MYGPKGICEAIFLDLFIIDGPTNISAATDDKKIVKGIPMYDLMDACCALQGGMELETFEAKNYALQHALNSLFGYLTPEAQAESNQWVDRKGWLKQQKIILS